LVPTGSLQQKSSRIEALVWKAYASVIKWFAEYGIATESAGLWLWCVKGPCTCMLDWSCQLSGSI